MTTISRRLFPLILAGALFLLAGCARMAALPSLPESHPESLAVGQQVNCLECHEDQQKGSLKSFSAFSHTAVFVRNHRFYAQSDDRLCASCHKRSFCADCHTNQVEMKPSLKYGNRPDREMPHRGDYLTIHKIEGKIDPASCYRCHGRGNNERCISCHR
ncbi:cytochrome C [Geomonas sp. RF6]|uniref:cytochrome C n=1 Tax=Geomonas sp. RF6 TaxID=2897342 RepID=UPI001E650655|nr:cytochrome C [Geomonas sp. RF6]UFS71853.1 cytochrome C [Geomonas sp. RF6]